MSEQHPSDDDLLNLRYDLASRGEYTDRDEFLVVARAVLARFGARQCLTCRGQGIVGGPSFYAPDEGGEPCPDCSPATPQAPTGQPAEPTDAMVDAYLKAQAAYVQAIDAKWGRGGKAPEYMHSAREACRAGLIAALAQDRVPLPTRIDPEPVYVLLRRTLAQLKKWQKKYGEHDPIWLPPDGDVRLAEDIDAILNQSPAQAKEGDTT